MLGYDQLAFVSPWDMSSFHHATAMFAEVHSPRNPLGLRPPDWGRSIALVWGGHRSLLFYAPIMALTPPGVVVHAARRLWGMAAVTKTVMGAVFLVNLSFPQWTGGWSTGPRLLVPLLPFAMLPVAALPAAGGPKAMLAAVVLALAGGVLILLFQEVGARIPQDIPDPLRQAVWPLWRGDPVPRWATAGRFTHNLVEQLCPATGARLPERWRWIQYAPLIVFQAPAIAAYCAIREEACPAVACGKAIPGC